jgi:nitrile hydratase
MGGAEAWNLDMSRHARERIPPADYLGSSYYEIWLKGLQRLMVERGLVTSEEIATGRSMGKSVPLPRKPTAEAVPGILANGAPSERQPAAPPLFKIGDPVRAKVINPAGHTRLPRYVRGRAGRIERVFAAHVFPDRNAHGLGEDPQWLYSVAFEATEIWGPQARPGDEVLADLWETYLERA